MTLVAERSQTPRVISETPPPRRELLRVRLEPPAPRHCEAFLAAERRSRALHTPWVTAPATPEAYAAFLERFESPAHVGHLVCREEDGALVGVVSVTEIVRGALQSAFLGYYAFRPYEGRGYMREGLTLALRHAFGPLALHRVEANIQPANEPSRRLVQRLGFRYEGLSKKYLEIRGRWRDHERWALLAEEWAGRD